VAIKNIQKTIERKNKTIDDIEATVEIKLIDTGVDVVDTKDQENEDGQSSGGKDSTTSLKDDSLDVNAPGEVKGVETISHKVILPKRLKLKNSGSIAYRLAKSRGQIRNHYRARVLSIISSGKCRKFMISEEVIAKIGNPNLIQVGITKEGILIAKILSANKQDDGYFAIRRQGSVYVLYSSSLVEEITREFALNFSNGSLNFNNVEYHTVKRSKAAHIKLK
jgi:hypothetical protein